MDTVWQWLKGGLLLAFIALVAGALQLPSHRTELTLVLAFGFGPALQLLTVSRLADSGGRLFALALASSLVAVGLGAAWTWRGVDPPAPFDVAPVARDVTLTATEDASLILEVHGVPEGRRESTARTRYQLDATRGGWEQALRGTLETSVETQPSRGGPPSKKVQRHWTERHVLGGSGGEVRVHFRELPELNPGELRLRSAPEASLLVVLGLLASLALAVTAEAAAGYARTWAPLTAAAAVSHMFGAYLAFRFDSDAPLASVFGAIVVSLIAGGVPGLALGLGAAWLARGKSVETRADKAGAGPK